LEEPEPFLVFSDYGVIAHTLQPEIGHK